ncbi:MAG: lysylphosphatidylglycerol synthase transmembrane domain-containing protein [Ferruginibacter sp.]
MNKRLLNILKYVIFLGGGAFLVWWQFHQMTADQEKKFIYAITHAKYWVLIPVIIMALASHLSRSIRWRILIEPLGYKPSIFNTFCATMVGYLANSFLPRLGEIIKCTMLGKYEKIPAQKLIGTIVVERIFDIICYIIFIIITVLIQYKRVGDFASERVKAINQHGVVPLWVKLLILTACILLLIFILRWMYKKYDQSRVVQKIKSFTSGIAEGIATVKKLKNRGWFIFHTVFIWSMYLMQIYVGFIAVSEVSHLSLAAACGVLTLATLAMIVTPNGLGTFPAAVFLVLQLYNVDNVIGEAFGWLMWGTTTFIILFFGSLFFLLMVLVNNKKTRETNKLNPV